MPRTQSYHLQLPHLFQDDKADYLGLLYGVRVARDLVMKLVILFLPIYLYQQGSQNLFWQFIPGTSLQKGILLIVLFYLIYRLTVLASALTIGKIISHIGYQRAMLIGLLLFALALSVLYWRVTPGWWLLVVAVIKGLETNFFWNSYFTLISQLKLRNYLGQDLGLLHFFVQLAQAIAPAMGGAIIVTLGFQSLFLVGVTGLLFALLFVLGLASKQLQQPPDKNAVSWSGLMVWVKGKGLAQFVASQASHYLHDAALVLWPLYIYLILGSVARVGFLYTFALFLALIISLGVGFYFEQNKNKQPFYISRGVMSLLWILRSHIISFWQIAIIDIIDRLTINFYAGHHGTLTVNSRSFNSHHNRRLPFFVYRELVISIVGIVFWLLLGSLFFIVSQPWQVLFIVASVGVLLSLLVKW